MLTAKQLPPLSTSHLRVKTYDNESFDNRSFAAQSFLLRHDQQVKRKEAYLARRSCSRSKQRGIRHDDGMRHQRQRVDASRVGMREITRTSRGWPVHDTVEAQIIGSRRRHSLTLASHR